MVPITRITAVKTVAAYSAEEFDARLMAVINELQRDVGSVAEVINIVQARESAPLMATVIAR